METIESFEDVLVSPTTAYRYLAKHAGGTECVGHTLKDHLNYQLLPKKDMTSILN